MKRLEKGLCILLICCMFFLNTLSMSVSAAGVASGDCGEGVTWTLDTDGTLKISGSGEMVIGWQKPWGEAADEENYYRNIKKIVVDDGVLGIPNDVFRDHCYVTEVIIADSVLSVGAYAFSCCEKLESVILSKNLSKIEDSTFEYCNSLKSIDIPQNVNSIGEKAFAGCSSLQSITIPNGVTDVEASAFSGCVSLDSVNFFGHILSIGDYAFSDCSSLKSVEFPDSITSIGDYAFSGCSGLKSVEFPDSITSIGSYAFNKCTSLESVSFPEQIDTIKDRAFIDCTALTYVELPVITNALPTGTEGLFSGCTGLVSVKIPEGETYIGTAQFNSCKSLISVELPSSLQYIADLAFANCENLQSIMIPKSVTSLVEYAFVNCSSLTELTFYHEAEDVLWLDEYNTFYNAPVSTIYVTDKDNLNQSVQKLANASSQQVVFKNITEKYTAGISSQEEASVDDVVEVMVSVNHGSDITFNAGEIQLTFDNTKLEFNQQASSLGTATVKVDGGSLILEDYGADKNLGNAVYTLAFTAKESGEAVVTMTGAAFADSADALKSDLIPAFISPATATVTINKKQFAVTLPEIFEGPSMITDGEDFTFRVADGDNYEYETVTATMNGQPVNVIDNKDGTYTIENVTGPLVITGSRIEKTYEVTFSGNAAEDITDADEAATYNTDYSFTMPTVDGWAYSLDSIMIGETAYTGYEVKDGVYTIAGTAIQGDIVITVSKVQTTAGVTVEGTGAGAAEGYDTTVGLGKDYVLTIVPEAGYTYTVTATMNGEAADVIDNGDNTYTVKAVSGALVFTVNRTVVVSEVEVIEYLTINNSKMWLIKNDTTVADGKVPTYDGEAMFWSDQYDAYCYLVIAQTLSEDEAAAKVGIKEGTAAVVDYGKDGKDVNGTGKVDAADAQLVYDMYNAKYSVFTADVTMEKFLRADVNGVDGVTVEDAAAIISAVLN